MRILHCCLAAFYIDDFSYQENIFPKMHFLQGHTVNILASTETYLETKLSYVKPSNYVNTDGIPVSRIPYVKWLPHFLGKKLRLYEGVTAYLRLIRPDVIFLHDCQFLSIDAIAKYALSNPNVKIYVDGHTDFMNSGKNWLSKNVLHKVIYRWCAQRINPYVIKFYGVLPIRAEFFIKVYGIPSHKVELLPLGVDLTTVDLNNRKGIKESLRDELGINKGELVFVTGGKLDKRKNIHVLMTAFNELKLQCAKLLVFGVPTKEMKDEIESLVDSPFIKYVGWLPADQTNKYLLAADIAYFPGSHSVLWEQSVGLGLPCIFRKWEGIQHIDLDGNCLFIETSELSEIKEKILLVYNNRAMLNSMKDVAEQRGVNEFSYYKIAKKAIED